MKSRSPLHVEVTRGPLVENIHQVVAVVIDKQKKVVGSAGTPDYVVTPRSCMKPLQALPLLETGAYEALGLNERHIALACSSHKAEPHQMEVLKAWLHQLGLEEKILYCGPATGHTSLLTHNCSGKHLGMISAARQLKMDPVGYGKFEHPFQMHLRKYLTEITEIDFSKAPHAIDGCCIPTYGVSLQKLAMAMSLLLSDETSNPHQKYFSKVFESMQKHPEYVSGMNEFVCRVNRVSEGRALVKTGADGVYIGFMPQQGLTFALKVIDGAVQAAEAASLYLLKEYGALTSEEIEKIQGSVEPFVLNSKNEKVGVIRVQSMS